MGAEGGGVKERREGNEVEGGAGGERFHRET